MISERRREQQRKWQRGPKGLAALTRYGKTAKGRLHRNKYHAKWQRDNPDKAKAHGIVFRAIKAGTLRREKCWCGSNGEAHHEDYNKPLEVEWLCRKHHMELHRKQT